MKVKDWVENNINDYDFSDMKTRGIELRSMIQFGIDTTKYPKKILIDEVIREVNIKHDLSIRSDSTRRYFDRCKKKESVMGKVSQKVIDAVEEEVKSCDKDLIGRCHTCNITLQDLTLKIQAKTGAPRNTVATRLSKKINELGGADLTSNQSVRHRLEREDSNMSESDTLENDKDPAILAKEKVQRIAKNIEKMRDELSDEEYFEVRNHILTEIEIIQNNIVKACHSLNGKISKYFEMKDIMDQFNIGFGPLPSTNRGLKIAKGAINELLSRLKI